jgi:hypothetical protein
MRKAARLYQAFPDMQDMLQGVGVEGRDPRSSKSQLVVTYKERE